MNTSEKIIEILDAMKNVLLVKNHRYGDSALTPLNIFLKPVLAILFAFVLTTN